MLALIPVFHILLNRTEIESGMSFPWAPERSAARKTSTICTYLHSKRMSHVSCCPISMYPIDRASWSNTARELQYLASLIQHFMGFRCLTQPEQGTSYHVLPRIVTEGSSFLWCVLQTILMIKLLLLSRPCFTLPRLACLHPWIHYYRSLPSLASVMGDRVLLEYHQFCR